MKPVYQDVFTKGKGNCFAACVASIFEVPLSEVPNFCAQKNWYDYTQRWLRQRGYQMAYIAVAYRDDHFHLHSLETYHIICGVSSRGLRHSCVGYNLDIVHDPHPQGDRKLFGDLDYVFFVPTEPRLKKAIQ